MSMWHPTPKSWWSVTVDPTDVCLYGENKNVSLRVKEFTIAFFARTCISKWLFGVRIICFVRKTILVSDPHRQQRVWIILKCV